MAEHIFGKSDRMDEQILFERADKPLNVKGAVNVQEIDHDQVCEEFASLLSVTKMDRHWKVLMMLRFSGLTIGNALEFAQIHGFLKGVRIHEAQVIENAALGRLKETLNGEGIKSVVEKYRENHGKEEKAITVAVPGNGHTDQQKDRLCQN
jgi:hypothetical protein